MFAPRKVYRGPSNCIARSCEGNVVAWGCCRFSDIQDPLALEVLACGEAILLARQYGFSNIILEGHAFAVVGVVSGDQTPLNKKLHESTLLPFHYLTFY